MTNSSIAFKGATSPIYLERLLNSPQSTRVRKANIERFITLADGICNIKSSAEQKTIAQKDLNASVEKLMDILHEEFIDAPIKACGELNRIIKKYTNIGQEVKEKIEKFIIGAEDEYEIESGRKRV